MHKTLKKNKILRVKYLTKNKKQKLHLIIQYMIRMLMILLLMLIPNV